MFLSEDVRIYCQYHYQGVTDTIPLVRKMQSTHKTKPNLFIIDNALHLYLYNLIFCDKPMRSLDIQKCGVHAVFGHLFFLHTYFLLLNWFLLISVCHTVHYLVFGHLFFQNESTNCTKEEYINE